MVSCNVKTLAKAVSSEAALAVLAETTLTLDIAGFLFVVFAGQMTGHNSGQSIPSLQRT